MSNDVHRFSVIEEQLRFAGQIAMRDEINLLWEAQHDPTRKRISPVWMPRVDESFGDFEIRIRCSHVSGLSVRRDDRWPLWRYANRAQIILAGFAPEGLFWVPRFNLADPSSLISLRPYRPAGIRKAPRLRPLCEFRNSLLSIS